MSVNEVEDLNGSSAVHLGDERKFFKRFGFGYRIVQRRRPKLRNKKTGEEYYDRHIRIKILHRSLYDKFISLQFVGNKWSVDKEVITQSDKFLLVRSESTVIYECKFRCLFASTRKYQVTRHEKTCSKETRIKTEQKCYVDSDIKDWLVKRNFLFPTSHVKQFVTYDIETLLTPADKMTLGKTLVLSEHKCILIAVAKNFGPEPRSVVIKRQSLDEKGYNLMLSEFYKVLKQFAHERLAYLPKEYITALTSISNTCWAIKNKDLKPSIEERSNFYKARRYLKQRMSLPIYGYNSERFDLPILFPGLLKTFSERGEMVSTIKNGSGYMRFSAGQYEFSDVMRFVAGGSLQSFARTWNASESKGIFPYELFVDIDSMRSCKSWPEFKFFNSTLNKNKSNVTKVGDKFNQGFALLQKHKDAAFFQRLFVRQMNLHQYYVNVPSYIPPGFDFKCLIYRDGLDESVIPVDPVLYVENWIEFKSKMEDRNDSCNSIHDFYGFYCAKDALILADAFTNYTETFISHHDVNPLDHLSLPSMASAILWKHYDSKINKPYSFGPDHAHLSSEIRQSIMGGLSTVFCRHAEVGGEKWYDDVVHTVPNGNDIKQIDCVDFNSK